MHKKFSKILIPIFILSFLLAPITPIFQNKNGNLIAGVQTNEAKAATATATINTEVSQASVTDTVIPVTIKGNDPNSNFTYIEAVLYDQFFDLNQKTPSDVKIIDNDEKSSPGPATITFTNLTPGTSYFLVTFLSNNTWSITKNFLLHASFANYFVPDDKGLVVPNNSQIIKTSTSATAKDATLSAQSTNSWFDLDYDCGFSNMKGCIASIAYNVIFSVSAWIARGAGSLLDFFVYYSTNSTSYTNDFINKGFAAIRDVANIFFIIALLYVAIKTILDINTTNNKKMIGTIVIVALLINFSLFFTQIVIDSTNILAKVFYNQITSVDENGNPTTAGGGGETSISVGLVSKFNPQNLLTAAMGKDNAQDYYINNVGQYIFITLLASAVILYAAYVFFMVALLFVGRVVMLWISMIFAPLAFASFTIDPGMKGIGWHDWWDNLSKNALLAPIFIFFLYIIVMFAGLLTTIVSYKVSSNSSIQSIMAVLIPFMILMILLMKAKDIAVHYSGEMGQAMTGLIKTAGGFVGGAALGAGALVGASTIGRVASRLSKSEGLKDAAEKGGFTGFLAKNTLKASNYGSKSGFDLRKGPTGKLLAQTGMNFDKGASSIGLGGAKTAGGFEAQVGKKQKALEKELELQKTTLTDDEVKAKFGGKYSTAAELNTARTKAFQENLGKRGFAYEVAKRATSFSNTDYANAKADAKAAGKPEPTFEQAQEAKIQKTKMAIGGAASLGLNYVAPTSNAVAQNKLHGKLGKDIKVSEHAVHAVHDTESKIKELKALIDNNSEIATNAKTAGVSIDQHISDKLASISYDMESAKTRETVLRQSRAKMANDIVFEQNGNKKRDMETQLKTIDGQLDTLKTEYISSMKTKDVYVKAKEAPEKIKKMEEYVNKEKGHFINRNEEVLNYADGGIPSPKSGGGGSNHGGGNSGGNSHGGGSSHGGGGGGHGAPASH